MVGITWACGHCLMKSVKIGPNAPDSNRIRLVPFEEHVVVSGQADVSIA
jgi:hypothetical protein